jgi:hypothetical protein
MPAEGSAVKCVESLKVDVMQWHTRLGHLGVTGMARLATAKAVKGLEEVETELSKRSVTLQDLCGGCAQGKAHRAAIGKGSRPDWVKAVEPMDRWHADSFGPFPPTLSGKRYMVLIVDEASDKTFGFTMKYKSDEASAIEACYRQVKVLHGKSLKEFHTDGGGEFHSDELKAFWTHEGTKPTDTMPHTSVHNPIAERKGRTVVEMLRSMLHHAMAPVELWGEAALTAVYLRNLVGVQAGHKETANQRWYPRKDTTLMVEKVDHLRTWGCDAWVHVPLADRTKLEAKAVLCIFIGYEESSLGYRFYDVERGKIIRSRDADFDEKKFTQCALLRQYLISSDDGLGASSTLDAKAYEEYLDEVFFEGSLQLGELLSAGENQGGAPDSESEPENKDAPTYRNAPLFDVDEESEYTNSDDSTFVAPNSKEGPAEAQPLRRSERVTRRTHQYAMVDLRDVAAEFAAVMEKFDGDADVRIVAAEAAQLDIAVKNLASLPDPKSLAEMRRAPDAEKFEEAIEDEHAALLKKKVMVEVDKLPTGARALPTKYVLTRKLNELGKVDRHKARLVVMGMLQRPGTDFDEDNLYAPTLTAASLRVLLAIATQLDLDLSSLDVKTAFLNAGLKEEIYITLPDGAKNSRNAKADRRWRIFRLLKALYGLKQAPKEWNEELDKTLTGVCGFTRLGADACLYVKKSKSGRMIYLAVFVDDMLFANHAKDAAELTDIKNAIKDKYEVSDGGECTFLLGMRIQRNRQDGSLTLDQQSYVERLLEKCEMTNAVPVSTPEQSGVKLTSEGSVLAHSDEKVTGDTRFSDTGELDQEMKEKYGSWVGALLYAAVWTRPDISHAVGVLTRFISKPRQAHWKACVRVLRYLKGTPYLPLTFRRDGRGGESTAQLGPVYTDSNWAGDLELRRSTSGVLLKMNGCAVAWSSRRQKSVAMSSTEAEYVALSEGVKEVLWLRQMLKELGHEQGPATGMLCDNDASVRTALNDTCQQTRMKHIDIRHHKIREEVANKSIALQWIPTLKQEADILTKGLGKHIFTNLRTKMMGHCSGSSALVARH